MIKAEFRENDIQQPTFDFYPHSRFFAIWYNCIIIRKDYDVESFPKIIFG